MQPSAQANSVCSGAQDCTTSVIDERIVMKTVQDRPGDIKIKPGLGCCFSLVPLIDDDIQEDRLFDKYYLQPRLIPQVTVLFNDKTSVPGATLYMIYSTTMQEYGGGAFYRRYSENRSL